MSTNKIKRLADPHKTKLRASCDGCYLTKIKCNKARPMCSRCLTYGTDCVYSPSSRSGRTRKDQITNSSKNDSEPAVSSHPQRQTCRENEKFSKPPLIYAPPVNLSDNESSYDFDPAILTPSLGATFDQYPLFDGDFAGSAMAMVPEVSPMESCNSDLWWSDAGMTATKQNNFSDNSMLPLTSDFLLSSPHGFWNQCSDGLLDFMSYNTSNSHSSPSHSPTTSISSALPARCNCFIDFPGDQPNHSCQNFHIGL